MKFKPVVAVVLLASVVVSLAAVVLKEARTRPAAPSAPPAGTETPVTSASHKVIAYYFHRTVRCETCRAIEAQAHATIEAEFTDPLKNGVLEWHVINVEEAGNAPFVKDYDLTTPSLVLVDLFNGQRVRWTKLNRVWELVHTPPAFAQYVQNELREYLGEP
jgi:hypothetical protein